MSPFFTWCLFCLFCRKIIHVLFLQKSVMHKFEHKSIWRQNTRFLIFVYLVHTRSITDNFRHIFGFRKCAIIWSFSVKRPNSKILRWSKFIDVYALFNNPGWRQLVKEWILPRCSNLTLFFEKILYELKGYFKCKTTVQVIFFYDSWEKKYINTNSPIFYGLSIWRHNNYIQLFPSIFI